MTMLNALKNVTNYTMTENGAVTHKTTRSDLLDMFAMGAAMRNRSDADVILMFQKAYAENPIYAMRCLFYIRDVRGGQGERRFFRLAMNNWATNQPKVVKNLVKEIPEYGRWDDLFALMGTPVEKDALDFIKVQLALDIQSKTPSLLAKWMPSENASSAKTIALGHKVRQHLGMTHKEYRKVLSTLRQRINIVERLMSENRWDEIEFDKIPSRAGLIYKNAFARRDIIKAKYQAFAEDKTTKVNASALYPYEVVKQAIRVMDADNDWCRKTVALDNTERLMVNKYWENLADYIKNGKFNGIVMADTSGSMTWGDGNAINAALGLAMYCAERAKGPFHNHFMTFSSQPSLIEFEGVDFCDKVARAMRAPWGGSTNIEAAFDLLLNTAVSNHLSQDDLPEAIAIVSDMEFDQARGSYMRGSSSHETLMEGIARKWATAGYKMPHLIFWNVNARQNNIPMLGNGPISFVSGFSPSIFETIISGKTGYDLMMDKLNSERYSRLTIEA